MKIEKKVEKKANLKHEVPAEPSIFKGGAKTGSAGKNVIVNKKDEPVVSAFPKRKKFVAPIAKFESSG